MELSKIVHLKVRHLEFSGDNDPHVACARGEDFASSFIPLGGLIVDDRGRSLGIGTVKRRGRERGRGEEKMCKHTAKALRYAYVTERRDRVPPFHAAATE